MGKLIRVMIVLAVCACFTTNTRAASIAEDVAKAQALSASGDNKGASAVYESLIASHPDSQGVPVWYCQASRCYWLMDMYEPCFAAREKAIELTSDPRAKRDWQYECADWYYLAGKYDKAISLLGKLISENPKDTNRALVLSYVPLL